MLTLSLRITGPGHAPSWMKILGQFCSTLDGCTHVERWHDCIGRQDAYKCEAIHQQYTGALTLSLHIPSLGHAPSWMKILGHLGSTLDGCTHVERWHDCIGRQDAYKCEAIHQQYTGVLTLSLRITGLGHAPSWMKIFGHLGSTLDGCTHVQRWHDCIGRPV